MKSFASLCFSILVALSGLYADDRPALEVKNKSSFQMESNGRSPFWPIGFKPAPGSLNPGAEHANRDIPLSAFLLTSITLDQGTRFAIINGKTMQEGQQFSLQSGTETYRINLKKIEDGRVILGRNDQEIVVPLRRK